MKRIYRIKRLNELLKHHEGYTLLDLMAILDVGERTIRKDIEQIQQPPYNAVLCNEYRGRERLYRYKDITFNLPLFSDNSEIKQKLDAAIESIEIYNGIPQFDWLKICLMAIEKGSVTGVSSMMTFESNTHLQGLGHIQILLDSIINKYPIKLSYQPYRSEKKVICVHPYHLRQYNNRWFLIGQPENVNGFHNYAIDRIISVEHLSKPFIETKVDFEEYFDDIIGVSVTDNPIEVVELMVRRKRYPYVKTKPLHWSQTHIKKRDNDEYVCIRLKVRPNRELMSLLLSFGPDIIVKSPESLRGIMAKKVEEMINAYNK